LVSIKIFIGYIFVVGIAILFGRDRGWWGGVGWGLLQEVFKGLGSVLDGLGGGGWIVGEDQDFDRTWGEVEGLLGWGLGGFGGERFLCLRQAYANAPTFY